jgi:hypothetical protein
VRLRQEVNEVLVMAGGDVGESGVCGVDVGQDGGI